MKVRQYLKELQFNAAIEQDAVNYYRAMGATHYDCDEGPIRPWHANKLYIYTTTIARDAWQQLMYTQVCRRRGHRWVEAKSYAGPDTGWEERTCGRCGYHFNHTWY